MLFVRKIKLNYPRVYIILLPLMAAPYTQEHVAAVQKAISGAKSLISRHALLSGVISGAAVAASVQTMIKGVPECTPGYDDAKKTIQELTDLYSGGVTPAPVTTPAATPTPAPVTYAAAATAIIAQAKVDINKLDAMEKALMDKIAANALAHVAANTPMLAEVPPPAPLHVPVHVAAPAPPEFNADLFNNLSDVGASFKDMVEQSNAIAGLLLVDLLTDAAKNEIFGKIKAIETAVEDLVDILNKHAAPAEAAAHK